MRALAIAVMLIPALAVAQPGLTPPIDPEPIPQPAPQPVEVRPVEAKDGTTATVLALGATLGGLALFTSGARHDNGELALAGGVLFLIGPSAGHIYAGETGHAVGMTLLRTAAVVAMAVSLASLIDEGDCEFEETCSQRDTGGAAGMFWLGFGTYAAVMAYDIYDAHRAAHRANRRAFVLAPGFATTPTGRAPIVSLGLRF